MNLETFLEILVRRKAEIETALTQLSNNYHMALGHQAEIQRMITDVEKEYCNANETKVDSQDNLPVE